MLCDTRIVSVVSDLLVSDWLQTMCLCLQPYQWSRFWSNALQRATAAEMEALIEEGLMAKLRASLEEAAIQGSPLCECCCMFAWSAN